MCVYVWWFGKNMDNKKRMMDFGPSPTRRYCDEIRTSSWMKTPLHPLCVFIFYLFIFFVYNFSEFLVHCVYLHIWSRLYTQYNVHREKQKKKEKGEMISKFKYSVHFISFLVMVVSFIFFFFSCAWRRKGWPCATTIKGVVIYDTLVHTHTHTHIRMPIFFFNLFSLLSPVRTHFVFVFFSF